MAFYNIEIMKKLLLASAIALFGALDAQLHIGAKGGLSVTTLFAEYQGTKGVSDSKIAPYFGLTLQTSVNEKLKFQAEALYTVLGGKNSENGESADFKIPEFIIPVSLKYYSTEKFYLQGVLNFGFISNPKVSVNSSIISGSGDASSAFKSLDMGLLLGAGFRVAPKLDLDARFNIGLNNISDMDGMVMRNNYWQVGLNYWFK